MRQEAFTEILSPKFAGFCSRMYVDYLDENKSPYSITEDYGTYLVGNFKYLIRKFNAQNGNEAWNIK